VSERAATREPGVAAADLAELVLLPPLLARLAQAAPGAQIRVANPEPDPFAQLDAGRADVSTGLFEAAPAGYRYQLLFADGYVLVARAGHPIGRGKLTLARLAEAPHVVVSPRSTERASRVDAALVRIGAARRVVATVPHFFAALHVIAHGDLVGFLPTRVAATSEAVLRLPPPLELPRFTVGQVWAERAQADPAHRWFREELRRAVGGT
jgi:DNA-binding transcriptional LysR family regulator